MNFNSSPFLALATLTFLLYYLPGFTRYQVAILIVASLAFYAYGQPYLLLLLLGSVTINSVCSFRVLQAESQRRRLLWAASGVIFNLSILVFFKYNRLVAEALMVSLSSIDGAGSLLLALPLPIGISFYTFHGISLVIDVFKRGDPKSIGAMHLQTSLSAHFRQTLLYLTFFPQLIAGPIVKAHFFYPQICPKGFRNIDWELAFKSLITGYFLKLVVADNLQDQTFWIAYPYFLNFSSLNLLFFLFGYSIQIFADFAGYSLIAIGLAALFGYRLPINFNFPYVSQSFSEFWTRWHMSLSSFLREYLYYPLGGNRIGTARTYINLMVVMALGGLWHGATLSYAAWGALHGSALVVERRFRDSRLYQGAGRYLVVVRVILVFVFVTFAWLLFKLPRFEEVVAFVQAMTGNVHQSANPLFIFVIALYSFPVIVYHLLYLLKKRHPALLERAQPAAYGVMLSAIMLNSGRPNAFIYFQF